MKSWSALVCLAAIFASACSGNSAPAAPTPSVSSITVTSQESMVLTGSTVQMTASSTLSNNTTAAPTCSWTSDTPSVATVNASGLVTGVGAGQANIICMSAGHEGHKLLRGLPNYAGNWSGSYFITNCTQTGFYAAASPSFCNTFTVNRVLPYNFILAQSGDTVTGRFFLGTIQFDQTTATVRGDGSFAFASTNTQNTIRTDVIWDVVSAQAGRLSGTHVQHWFAPTGTSGDGTVASTIRDGVKTSSVRIGTRRITDLSSLFNAMLER